MISKTQYKILQILKSRNVLDPIPHVEILSCPFYRNKSNASLTEKHLVRLSELGYITNNNLHAPYHLKPRGDLSIMPAGIQALEEYAEAQRSKRLSLVISILALIFSAIAAFPVIISFIP